MHLFTYLGIFRQAPAPQPGCPQCASDLSERPLLDAVKYLGRALGCYCCCDNCCGSDSRGGGAPSCCCTASWSHTCSPDYGCSRRGARDECSSDGADTSSKCCWWCGGCCCYSRRSSDGGANRFESRCGFRGGCPRRNTTPIDASNRHSSVDSVGCYCPNS
jgi:hypothetical protein